MRKSRRVVRGNAEHRTQKVQHGHDSNGHAGTVDDHEVVRVREREAAGSHFDTGRPLDAYRGTAHAVARGAATTVEYLASRHHSDGVPFVVHDRERADREGSQELTDRLHWRLRDDSQELGVHDLLDAPGHWGLRKESAAQSALTTTLVN